jgi:hypothetical protein
MPKHHLGGGATLTLKKPEAPVDPAFDPQQPFAEVGGVEGVQYIQGQSYFNRAKQYVGPAPEAAWLTPATPEQLRANRVQEMRNKAFFERIALRRKAEIPKPVLDAEREDARARAAEHWAA